MALTFVLGNAGSGKSTFLRNFILDEAKKNPQKKYLVLVPEQFTMSTQKEYVEASGAKCIMNIDVLSFERLAYRVFEELGMTDLTILEDTGKMLVLRQIVQQHRDELTVLKHKVEKPGYLDQVKSLLTEFAQYNVTVTDLEKMIENTPKNILNYKLQDLCVLYKGLEDYLRGNYITAEKLLVLLADVAERSMMLKDAVVCFDGYTGFTPVQNLFMRKLLPLAQDVYVTVLLDVREDARVCSGNHELFYISKKFIRQMSKLADETGTLVGEDIIMPQPAARRFVNAPGLAALEKNIFHPKKEIFEQKQDNVEIIRCLNPKKELHYVAGRIHELIRRGYRYEDCAIVTADLKTYGRYVKKIFDKAHIPYFLDEKDSIIYSGFVEFIKGSLEMVIDDFSQESVFRYLKSGMTDLTELEIDELENYVLALRIKGHQMYATEFVRRNRTYKEEDLQHLNKIREKLMNPLTSFFAMVTTKNAGPREYATALYVLLEYYHADVKLSQEKDYLFDRGEVKRSKEYEQSYDLVIDLLDKCVALLGHEIMSAEEFLEILTAGIEHSKIGAIPAGRDCVIIGDMERTRLEHIKVLFFVGVNDGIIPRITTGSMCLSQKERELLGEMQVELAASPKERSFIQQFYLYLVMTKPSEKLIITYGESNGEGVEAKPAYIISQLHHMFPKLEEQPGETRGFISPELSFRKVVDNLRDQEIQDISVKLLYDWYQSQPEWKERLQPLIQQATYAYKEERLSAEVAKAIYGEELAGSISRFEDYSRCAMKHFLDYGIALSEREEGEFQATELGTIVHKALELYGKYVQEAGIDFAEVSEQQQEEFIRQAVAVALGEQMDSALYENARSEYQMERISRLVHRSVWGLTRQFKGSSYVPRFFEQRFDEKIGEQSNVKIRGVIDRIDVTKNENDSYRVVDYKTGNTKLDLKEIYAGLQLQLMIYLDAADKIMKKHYPQSNYEPDGAYYYIAKDPMVELKDDNGISDETLSEMLEKELQMAGFGRNHNEDRGIKTKKLQPSVGEIEEVVAYAKKKMEQIGEEILDGHIEAKPYRLGDSTGCDYCSYKGICRFDEKMEGYEYREVENASEEEILAKIKSENNF